MSSERLTSAQCAIVRCLEQKNHSIRSNTSFALEMTRYLLLVRVERVGRCSLCSMARSCACALRLAAEL